MEFTINDKTNFYECYVIKTFKTKREAKLYSEKNNIALQLDLELSTKRSNKSA